MTEQTARDYTQRMLVVLTFIEAHLEEPLHLDTLARVVHFSPYHFHRIFRGMVGESVKSYVRRLRLERAANRLVFGDRPVVEIALDAGYETHESFTRAFRSKFGQTPTEHRRNHRMRWHEAGPFTSRPDLDRRLKAHRCQRGESAMKVRVVKYPRTRVAYIRHVGPYQEVAPTWQKLCAWAGPRNLLTPDAVFLGICHDDPEVTEPDKIRCDASVALPEGVEVEIEGEVGQQEIGGGEYAVATHEGPYSTLMQTYAYICGQWAPNAKREIRSAPSYEHYLNSPTQVPEEALRTDVHVPLEPA